MKGFWARNLRYLFLPALSADLEIKTVSFYKLCLFWQNQPVPGWFLQCQNSCPLLNLLKNDLLTPLLNKQSGYRVWKISKDGLKCKLWTNWFYIRVHEHRVKFVYISFILICGCSVTIYLSAIYHSTLLLNTHYYSSTPVANKRFQHFPWRLVLFFHMKPICVHQWLTFWLCFQLCERHGHVVKCSDSSCKSLPMF